MSNNISIIFSPVLTKLHFYHINYIYGSEQKLKPHYVMYIFEYTEFYNHGDVFTNEEYGI